MKLLKQIFIAGLLTLSAATLIAQDVGFTAIREAANENKSLFIFLYKDQSEKTLKLQKIFEETTTKLGSKVRSVKIKADDPAEKAFIDKFSLKRFPMPFVLVVAPNGAITGGFPTFTEEQLVNSIASPGAASCLKALQDRKLVLLCLQNSQTVNNDAALKGVKDFTADPRFANAAEMVMIDPANIQEHQFLSQLALDTHSSQAITVLIAPPAEVIATYQGPTSMAQFMSDLQKASSGCCGPGGCCPGGKCGPSK